MEKILKIIQKTFIYLLVIITIFVAAVTMSHTETNTVDTDTTFETSGPGDAEGLAPETGGTETDGTDGGGTGDDSDAGSQGLPGPGSESPDGGGPAGADEDGTEAPGLSAPDEDAAAIGSSGSDEEGSGITDPAGSGEDGPGDAEVPAPDEGALDGGLLPEAGEDAPGPIALSDTEPPAKKNLSRDGANPDRAPSYGLLAAVAFEQVEMAYLGSIALDRAGAVWVWGYNGQGQLGNGKRRAAGIANTSGQDYAGGMQRVPQFKNPGSAIQVEAGYHHFIVLDSDHKVWTWGYNNRGQIGTGAAISSGNGTSNVVGRNLPVQITIPNMTGYVVQVEAGDDNTAILTSTGEVWCWGAGDYGGGGNGVNTSNILAPVKALLPSDIHVKKINLGSQHVLALTTDGEVYAWGYNSNGQVGSGVAATGFNTPQKVLFPAGTVMVDVDACYQSSLGLDEDGNVWQWGRYHTANASSSARRTPVIVAFPSDFPGVKNITCGQVANYVTDINGRIWVWGSNVYSAFGVDTNKQGKNYNIYTGGTAVGAYYQLAGTPYGYSATPVQYPKYVSDGDQTAPGAAYNNLHPQGGPFAHELMPYTDKVSTHVSCTVALDADGNIWIWGYDGSGAIAWGYGTDPGAVARGTEVGYHFGINGMFDRYNLAPMWMQGSPRANPIGVTVDKPVGKIYKGVTPEDSETVKVNITVPPPTERGGLGNEFIVDTDVDSVRYVFIEDTESPEFALDSSQLTKDVFESAYDAADISVKDDITGDLSDFDNSAGMDDLEVSRTFTVSDNAKVWILVNGHGYSQDLNEHVLYNVDNFYTPLNLYEKGVKKSDPSIVLYDLAQDEVEKVYPTEYDLANFGTDTQGYTDQDSATYGIPLYSDNSVVYSPLFGFDQVRITALDVPDYELSTTRPPEPARQYNPVTYTLDTDYAAARSHFNDRVITRGIDDEFTEEAKEENTHTFYYRALLPHKSAYTYIEGVATQDEGLPDEPVGVEPDDEIIYTITLEISEPPESGDNVVTVTDRVPDGLTVEVPSISYGGVFNSATNTVTWTLTDEDPGEITLEFSVKVSDSEEFNWYENTAHVVYSDGREEDTNETWHCIYAKVTDFTFYKVDENGDPIENVLFALYSCEDADDPGHVHDWLADEGSCWGNPVYAYSAADGLVEFAELPSGDFMLAEIETRSGYQLPYGQWLIAIDEALEISITAHGSSPAAMPPAFKPGTGKLTGFLLLPNYPRMIMPMMGGVGVIILIVAGIALIGAAIIFAIASRGGGARRSDGRRC